MLAPPSEASQKGNKVVQTQLNVPKNVRNPSEDEEQSSTYF